MKTERKRERITAGLSCSWKRCYYSVSSLLKEREIEKKKAMRDRYGELAIYIYIYIKKERQNNLPKLLLELLGCLFFVRRERDRDKRQREIDRYIEN